MLKKLSIKTIDCERLDLSEKANVLAGADTRCNIDICYIGCTLPGETFAENYNGIDVDIQM